MGHCCRLGAAIDQERVLFTTDNFFVVPTFGSIGIEGYLLVIPKDHHLGVGMVPESQYTELNGLVEDTLRLLKATYGVDSVIFEHGPRMKETDSCCIDHAHLHIVPGVDITDGWATDLMGRLSDYGMFYRVEMIKGWSRTREMLAGGESYLFMRTPEGIPLMSNQNFLRPSQYFRKMVADSIGSREWNWRNFPDYVTLNKTIERLKGKL